VKRSAPLNWKRPIHLSPAPLRRRAGCSSAWWPLCENGWVTGAAADLIRRVATFEVQVNQDPFAAAARLWVKDHLDPEEEELRFSSPTVAIHLATSYLLEREWMNE
jgi:hypothetical protein